MATTTIITLLVMLLFCSTLSSGPAVADTRQFRVGGSRGWAPPADDGGSHSFYSQWASEYRFHVGDSLLFAYSNESESVLVVNSTAYANCIPSHPILRLDGTGNTTFQFDRPGLFYFISARVHSCISGQKLLVRVMDDDDDDHRPSPAPAATTGNNDLIWDDGLNWPPAINSTVKTTIASYFITTLGGVLVILYLLM
ncbi:Early nodulin-like protein 2 [Linum perenne]